MKVCLKHLQLFFSECCSDSFGFVFMIAVSFTSICNVQSQQYSIKHYLLYRRLTSFHHRRSQHNEFYTALFRLEVRIARLLRVAGRIGHKQSRQDGTPTLEHVSPSPKLLFRDNILNILLRNSWKATQEMLDIKKIMKKSSRVR